MERRISPPKEFEELLDRLTEAVGEAPALFASKQKALMFAAGLGKYLGKKTALEKKGTAIRMDIFQNALDDGYINALAAEEMQSLGVLASEREDEKATIFEQYANCGLKEIQSRCYDVPGDPLQILLGIAEDARRPSSTELSGLDASVLRDLLR